MNISLFNALTRHQVYIEGLKAYQANNLAKTMSDIDNDIRQKLAGIKYNSLDQMTKKELTQFISALQKSLSKYYNSYTSDLLTFLQNFCKQDRKIFLALFAPFAATVALSVAAPTSAAIFASAINAPLPANGLTVANFNKTYIAKSINDISAEVRKGYANKSKPSEVTDAISGTSEFNQKDGLLNKLYNGGKAVLNTEIQHVTASTQDAISQKVFKQYIWISVLDGKTTQICISRAGNVYNVGEGPLPPAHINCRSKAVPYGVDNSDEDQSGFGVWAKGLPSTIRADMFGQVKSSDYANAESATELVFSGAKPINLTQFASKLDIITGEKGSA